MEIPKRRFIINITIGILVSIIVITSIVLKLLNTDLPDYLSPLLIASSFVLLGVGIFKIG